MNLEEIKNYIIEFNEETAAWSGLYIDILFKKDSKEKNAVEKIVRQWAEEGISLGKNDTYMHDFEKEKEENSDSLKFWADMGSIDESYLAELLDSLDKSEFDIEKIILS